MGGDDYGGGDGDDNGDTAGCTKYQHSNNEGSDNNGDDDIVSKGFEDFHLLGDDKLTDLFKTGMGGGLSFKRKPERFWLKTMSSQAKHDSNIIARVA